MARIDIPDGEDPLVYALSKAGSPILTRRRAESMAAQYVNDTTLTARERELCRMLIAHMMGCSHCLKVRMGRDRPGFAPEPIPESFYTDVLDYRTAPGYSDRERLAAEFCERYANDHLDLAEDEETWDRLHAAFTDQEIADLCIMAGTWEAGRRMFQILQVDTVCDLHTPDGPLTLKVPAAMKNVQDRE